MNTISEFRVNSQLTDEQYKYIDTAVKETAMLTMVGRSICPVSGPHGFGKEAITYDKLIGMSDAELSYTWKSKGNEDMVNLARTTVPVPVLKKLFKIEYRKLAASRTAGTALDVQNARNAATKVAALEDELIFMGYAPDGSNYDIEGLYTAAGNDYSVSKDFSTVTNVPAALKGAIALLTADGVAPPYNLSLNPVQYTELLEPISGAGAYTYMEYVKKTIGGNIYMTNALAAGTGLMSAAGNRGYFDFALGVDLSTAMEQLGLDQGWDMLGVVYETGVPRVWEANALCKLSNI